MGRCRVLRLDSSSQAGSGCHAMNAGIWGLIAAAFAVGAAVPMQSAINARMAFSQGHPLYGALTNTAVASITLVCLIVALRLPAPNLRAAAQGPMWLWCGGLVGAAFVFGGLFVAPRIGAAAFTAATVLGSVVASLAIDHFGWLNFPVQPLSMWRLMGAACILAGVAMLQAGRV